MTINTWSVLIKLRWVTKEHYTLLNSSNPILASLLCCNVHYIYYNYYISIVHRCTLCTTAQVHIVHKFHDSVILIFDRPFYWYWWKENYHELKDPPQFPRIEISEKVPIINQSNF